MTDISWWRTSVGEAEISSVADALRKEYLSQGPLVAEFEEKLSRALDVPYVVTTPSGSASLLMVMLAIGVGPGDEVIVPNITWIASAHGAALLGAKIILADTLEDRPILDVGQIENLITEKTKAVVPVHLNGRAADLASLKALAAEHGFAIIEDACQALFSKNREGYLGTQADIGCFSLGVTKLITTGQGGFVTTRNADIFEKLKTIKMHGVVTDDNGLETYQRPGFNFKFAGVLAAIGLEQLTYVDQRRKQVRVIHDRYAPALAELDYLRHIPVEVDAGELPLWVEIATPHREALKQFLAKKGLQTQRVHLSLDNAAHLGGAGQYPNSKKLSREGLILPCGPSQPLENIDRVIDALRNFRPGT